MATLNPCIGCTARKNCVIKWSALKAMREAKLTSAKIACKLPFTEYFPPGTRVQVRVWDFRDDEPDIGSPGKFVPGTVFGPSLKKRGRLNVRLDQPISMQDQREISFRAVWPKDTLPLDEPRAELCDCGRPLVNGDCDNWVHHQIDNPDG